MKMTLEASDEKDVSLHDKKTVIVASNRATQLRMQKLNQDLQNGQWKGQANQHVLETTPHTLPRGVKLSGHNPKQINNSILSKVQYFEGGTTVTTTQSFRTVEKTSTKTEVVNGTSSLKRVQSSMTVKTSPSPEFVLPKTANTVGIQSRDAIQRRNQYRTVNVKKPSIDINVSPWQYKGPIVTDTDNEGLLILEKRKKRIDEGEKESEDSKSQTESAKEESSTAEIPTIEIRPPSVDLSDREIVLTAKFPRAIDLARHGHRPLWKDIPGVVEANIAESLDKNGRIRQEAKFEVMLSEGTFLHSVNQLTNHYMKHIQKHIPHVLTEKDYDILFKNVLDVRSCSEAFLTDLDALWQSDVMLDGIYEIIRTHATDRFKAYVRYCSNMLDMSKHLTHLTTTNAPFKDLLEVLINREGAQRLTLDAFLTSPMQRITKFPLLMKSIQDKLEEGSEEYKLCKAAHDATSTIATECNEVVNTKKRLEELLLLSRQVEFADATKTIPLIIPNRSLVSRANVKRLLAVDKAQKREKLQLILFNDLLLVTKRKSEKLFSVIDHCVKDRVQMRALENENNNDHKKALVNPAVISLLNNSHDKKVDLVVTFKEQTQCKEWLQIFAKNSSEEDDDGTIQYIAILEHESTGDDELELLPGDVLQLIKELEDGWAEGELLNTGKKGRFPTEKAAKITSAKAKAANYMRAKKELRASRNFDESSDSVRSSRSSEDLDKKNNRSSKSLEDVDDKKGNSVIEETIEVQEEGAESDNSDGFVVLS